MHDPSSPSAIIARTLQRAFPSGGEWTNWRPMADHILTALTEAGFGIVPVRLQDQRLTGQDWSPVDNGHLARVVNLPADAR